MILTTDKEGKVSYLLLIRWYLSPIKIIQTNTSRIL